MPSLVLVELANTQITNTQEVTELINLKCENWGDLEFYP